MESSFDIFLTKYIEDIYPITEREAVIEANMLFNDLAKWVSSFDSILFPYGDEGLEAAGYSSSSKEPIFIVLTKGHTPISYIIYGMTGDEHSHASISFDIDMKEIYSFGTKKLNPKREMGFVLTSFDADEWGPQPTEFDIYVTHVSKADKQKMLKRLQYFTENADSLKYHWAGLVRIFFNIKTNNSKKWICSRFVAALLGEAGVKLDRDSSLYRPDQLTSLDNVEFVIHGDDIHNYDAKKAKAALKKVQDA